MISSFLQSNIHQIPNSSLEFLFLVSYMWTLSVMGFFFQIIIVESY